MKVKLLTLMAGPDGVFNAGQIIDVPDEQAQSLIESRCAYAVDIAEKKISIENTAMHIPENEALEYKAKKRKKA